jgi:biotin carboxyl carrier protein
MGALTNILGPADVPAGSTPAQIHTALGYQAKGLEFVKKQKSGKDLTPLLTAPHVLHSQPRTLAAGTTFELLQDAQDINERVQVVFQGFGTAPNGDVTMSYLLEGQTITVSMEDPNKIMAAGPASGPRKADPGNSNELACIVPGEVLSYAVKAGDVLKAGEALCVLESMKMEMKIPVPDELDGKKVKNLPCKIRTKTDQGDVLAPGHLLLELEDA